MRLGGGVPTSIPFGGLHMPAFRKGETVFPVGDGRRLVLLESEESAIRVARSGMRKIRAIRLARFALIILASVIILKIAMTPTEKTDHDPEMPVSQGVLI